MWSKMFVRSSIVQKNVMCVVLTMTYSYYGLYYYDEVHVLESVEDARNLFCRLRSNDQLRIETVSDRAPVMVESAGGPVVDGVRGFSPAAEEKKESGREGEVTPPVKSYAEIVGNGALKVVSRE